MNKTIAFPIATFAILAVLAGCKSSPGVSATEASQRAHALATSTAASQAAIAGKDLAQTCLPAKDLNRAYLVGLAVNLKEAEALAGKCEIPKADVEPFAKAVLSSVSTAYLSGNFSTPAQRTDWAEKSFPKIVKQYQK